MENDFDKRFGFILKHNIDTKESYKKTKEYHLTNQNTTNNESNPKRRTTLTED